VEDPRVGPGVANGQDVEMGPMGDILEVGA